MNTRKCSKCKQTKDLETHFYYKNLHKEARCKECVSELRKAKYALNPEMYAQKGRERRLQYPEKMKDTKLRQTYGISFVEYTEILTKQNGVCAICNKPETTIWQGKVQRLAVDHAHDETKAVRGLLCNKCNRAFGLVEENLNTILSMLNYLNKYKKVG